MKTTDDKRYPYTVRSALRRCRQILKDNGYPLGKMLGRYYAFGPAQEMVEGPNVSRVGCSRTIAITWFARDTRGHQVGVAYIAALFRSYGLPFSRGQEEDGRPLGWMDCRYS